MSGGAVQNLVAPTVIIMILLDCTVAFDGYYSEM